MRRPKAAIPILPPPDNQQSSRGRGRSTQQYQNNQSNNTQQIEQQEVKSGNAVESDEKPMPGQFDSAQIEQSYTPDQEPQKNQVSDMVRTVNDADEKIEINTNVDNRITVDALVQKDNLEDSVSVKELLETTSNENNTIADSPTTLTVVETERELGNIESTIPESTIVEKAAA